LSFFFSQIKAIKSKYNDNQINNTFESWLIFICFESILKEAFSLISKTQHHQSFFFIQFKLILFLVKSLFLTF